MRINEAIGNRKRSLTRQPGLAWLDTLLSLERSPLLKQSTGLYGSLLILQCLESLHLKGVISPGSYFYTTPSAHC